MAKLKKKTKNNQNEKNIRSSWLYESFNKKMFRNPNDFLHKKHKLEFIYLVFDKKI